jgi:hypothetical protein
MIPMHQDPSNPARSRGPLVKGWKSNHVNSGGAAAWATAQVRGTVNSDESFLLKKRK